MKGTRKRPYHKVKRQSCPSYGESIENRPEEVNSRETFGNWKMDCVEGKKRTKRTLLVLTEPQTRHLIIQHPDELDGMAKLQRLCWHDGTGGLSSGGADFHIHISFKRVYKLRGNALRKLRTAIKESGENI